MAYRVGTSLTLGETIRRLTADHGCRLVEVKLLGPKGPTVARRLVRMNEHGQKRVATLPLVPDDAMLIPTGVRTICAQLGRPTSLASSAIRLIPMIRSTKTSCLQIHPAAHKFIDRVQFRGKATS